MKHESKHRPEPTGHPAIEQSLPSATDQFADRESMQTVADYLMQPAIYNRLQASARRFAATSDEAEEAVQDTIAAAMVRAGRSASNIERLTDPKYLTTMLRTTTVSNWRSLHHGRGQNPTSFEPLTEVMQRPAGIGRPSIDEQAANQVLVGQVLKRLSPDHRQALEMVVMQQMTVSEAAEYTGIQEGTIKSRLHYARRAARGILRSLGATGDDIFS